jgi:hypothetical protein
MLVFFGVFTGGMTFVNDLMSSHSVQSNTTVNIEDEYDTLSNDIDRAAADQEKFTSGDSIVERAAGLYVVPRVIDILTAPVSIVDSTLDSISAAYPALVPGWVVGLLKTLIYGSLFFAIIGMMLRYRT